MTGTRRPSFRIATAIADDSSEASEGGDIHLFLDPGRPGSPHGVVGDQAAEDTITQTTSADAGERDRGSQSSRRRTVPARDSGAEHAGSS